MKLRRPYELPQEKQHQLKKARLLEWLTIGFILSIIVVMYLTMGASQAMKTAWIEDVLSLIPPISFLVAIHYRERGPSDAYPYGRRRATQLAFLSAAVAILVLGLYMLYDSSMALIKQERPTLAHFNLFGWHVWSGWVMIGALVYSIIPPMVLGQMKLPLSTDLREKTLHADATMNKDDWMTGGAAIIGILGIGLGWWWADAVAAGFIALSVLKDGFHNVSWAMTGLMDHRPTEVSSREPLDLADDLRERLRAKPGFGDVALRLREEGPLIAGEVFVVPSDAAVSAHELQETVDRLATQDWRLYELVVVPVRTLDAS